MEIKEQHALVMTEDGQILRISYKDGMKVGDCIYILEEDILKKTGKKQKIIWKQMVAVAAACALFVTSFIVFSEPKNAYAMVSVDGEKTVELVLNQKNQVKEVDSKKDSFTREEENAIKGEKVETIKDYFSQDLLTEETIIVGYAFLDEGSEEERAELQRRLEKTFGTDHLLYLVGDKEDVENAKKEGKSLGVYLAEQVLAEENFHKVVNKTTEEEALELLEKNPSLMDNPTLKETIRQKLSDYEDADEFEEEDADYDGEKNEDILEQQKEKQEEQEEPDSVDESDEQEMLNGSSEYSEEMSSYESESEDELEDGEGEETETLE